VSRCFLARAVSVNTFQAKTASQPYLASLIVCGMRHSPRTFGLNENSCAVIQRCAGQISLGLLCSMFLFSPWAFGTTQPWSVLIMSWAAAALGALCGVRLLIRRASGSSRPRSISVPIMASLTALLLAYIFVSAWNAGAVYLSGEWRLHELPHIHWLPHSYDAPATWIAFWQFCSLAAVFWSVYDLLADHRSGRLSSRLSIILWVLSLNATALALEAIIQRTSGTSNLLWIMPTEQNKEALSQFGPYAYRSNAAQYLNLIWPVTLGFWWWLHQDRSRSITRRGVHHILLPCIVTMAAASLYSLSRGGVAVAGLLVVGLCVLFVSRREAPIQLRIGVVALGVLILAVGAFISWGTMGKRLASTMEDPLLGRRETYALAEGMARDYPWFGTGAGTFASLFQMYRQSPDQYWPSQLHNDWSEYRITFGRIGFAMILAALALAMTRWLWRGGATRDPFFLTTVFLALSGCLLHARFDFPFQIYSIEFHAIVLCAILFSSSRHARIPK
jgi:O-antigen ligase